MHSRRTFIIKIIFRSLSEKLISRGDQRVTILAEMIQFFANDSSLKIVNLSLVDVNGR